MSHRERRATALLTAAVSSCLALSACTSEEGGAPAETPGAAESASPEVVPRTWVEREVRVRTLDRMMTEGDPQEVMDNTGDLGERLLETRIVQEGDDGYVVELDKDEWDPDAVTFTTRLDAALAEAMSANEVTWCEETVPGDEFVRSYLDEYWEAFDSEEEYVESIEAYVDCRS
ncbi:hypothetical protein [Nocardiopsis sp. NRRL B-16309]|uniref:hypothetical protein n=1 Tax=Nocardiopsis sp. NRRL B-16309 TaxID=1519494 RepID=UPI0012E21D9D|nr:hypothetical protein [Nocardiopsis sp. NRRL B-16309]